MYRKMLLNDCFYKVQLRKKGFTKYGYLKNLSFTYFLLLIKVNWFNTYSSALIFESLYVKGRVPVWKAVAL